jgi:hypothetical protein
MMKYLEVSDPKDIRMNLSLIEDRLKSLNPSYKVIEATLIRHRENLIGKLGG